MKSSVLRSQVEQSLAHRIHSALTVRARVERDRVSCGIEAIDHLLSGGMPVGAITELVGKESSGRTTAAVSLISELTRSGTVCAWVDVADTLDPEAAAANGVALERLLWVRCRNGEGHPDSPENEEMGSIRQTFNSQATAVEYHTGGGLHPRSEGIGMPQAVEQLLAAQPRSAAMKESRRERSSNTSCASNRSFMEQMNDGRRQRSDETSSWDAIEHALRATDLLLQGAGFSAIVLDLGSTSAKQAWRIPLSSWFRFRAACERSQASLIVLTQHPCARSSAELVVHMHGGEMSTDARVMDGVQYHAEVERQRFVQQQSNVVSLRKPPQPEHGARWIGRAAWAKAK